MLLTLTKRAKSIRNSSKNIWKYFQPLGTCIATYSRIISKSLGDYTGNDGNTVSYQRIRMQKNSGLKLDAETHDEYLWQLTFIHLKSMVNRWGKLNVYFTLISRLPITTKTLVSIDNKNMEQHKRKHPACEIGYALAQSFVWMLLLNGRYPGTGSSQTIHE